MGSEDGRTHQRLHLAIRPLTPGQRRPAGRDAIEVVSWVVIGVALAMIVVTVGSFVVYALVAGDPGYSGP